MKIDRKANRKGNKLIRKFRGGREERLEFLEKRMDEMGVPKDNMWWYLEWRKYGGVKHSGFGLGFERLIMYITGMSNIRDDLPFPRTTGQSEF